MSSSGMIKGIPGAVRNVSSKAKKNPMRESFRNTDAKYSSRKPTYAEMVLDGRANLKDVAPVVVNAGGHQGGDNMAQVVVNAGVNNVVPVVVHAGEGAAVNHDGNEAEPVMADARAGTWWCTIL